MVIYYRPNTLVESAVEASSNPMRLNELFAVVLLTINLSPGPITIEVILSTSLLPLVTPLTM